MAVVIKFIVKDINPDRLREELEVAGILPNGAKFAGFHRKSDRLMEPFTETEVISTSTGQPDVTADPGELHFKYDSDPGAPLDTVLASHDAANLSTAQQNEEMDYAAIPILVNRYQNWATLSNPQKDTVLQELTRLVARLLDSSQDL